MFENWETVSEALVVSFGPRVQGAVLTLAVGYVFVKVLARRAPRRPHLTVAATGDVDLGEGGIPPEPAVGPDLDPDGRRLGATRRVRAFGSAWIDMNLLSINPNLVVVDRDQTT